MEAESFNANPQEMKASRNEVEATPGSGRRSLPTDIPQDEAKRIQQGISVTVRFTQQQKGEPRMHLYEMNPSNHHLAHVVARTPQEAVDLFITWSAANGRVHESFTVDRLLIGNLKPEQQAQVRSAFSAGLVGVSHFDEETGWTFSPPLWQSIAHAEVSAIATEGGAA